MNILEIKNIEKSFGENKVLRDISLSVKDGEIVSVIGPSGSGKIHTSQVCLHAGNHGQGFCGL